MEATGMNSSKIFSQLNIKRVSKNLTILPDVPLEPILMFQQVDWTGHTARSNFQENNITVIISCSHTVAVAIRNQ